MYLGSITTETTNMPLKRSPGDGNLHGTIITDNEPVINGGGGGSQIPPWDNTVPPPPPAEPERKRAAVQVTAAKNTSPEKEKALPAKKKTSPTKKTRTKKTLVVETEKKERQRRVGRVAPRPVPIIVPTRPQERIVEVGLLDEQQTPSPPLRPQPQAPSSPILQPQAPFPPQMPIVVPTWEQEMAVAGYLLDEPPPLQRLQAPPPYVPVGVPTWQQEIMSIMGYSFNEQPILPPSPPPPQQLPPPPQQQQSPSPTFTTKNEKKWNDSLQKLVKYKNEHEGSTLVPQCYHEDYQLGRWVHYQRGMFLRWPLVCLLYACTYVIFKDACCRFESVRGRKAEPISQYVTPACPVGLFIALSLTASSLGSFIPHAAFQN